MAANKTVTVTVIPPRGPSGKFKFSSSTTILHVLEEASKKYNLNPSEYDLKNCKEILNVELSFQHANITNFAKLELVPRKVPRKLSSVKICIELNNGERKSNEYLPDVNIQQVLSDLNIDYNLETAVIVYLRKEILAKEFETTTLKSLGLISNGGLFRLHNRDPQQLVEQAHVYVPPTPKITKIDEDEGRPRPVPVAKSETFNPISIIRAEKGVTKTEDLKSKDMSQDQHEKSTPMEISSDNCIEPKKAEEKSSTNNDNNNQQTVQDVAIEDEEIKYEFLGERQALLFNSAAAKAISHTELPNEFFDHTISDAKVLHRDVRKKNERLTDAPLITAAQRQLEKDKERLTTINKYKTAVIRVHFPNQLVLQANFKPYETVQTIKDFIKNYLEPSETDFELFTTPPRCNLNPKQELLDLELVPTANIYYSGEADLKSDIKTKLTDPKAADYAATKIRLTTTRNDVTLFDDGAEVNEQPSTSATAPTTITIYEPQPNPDRSSQQTQNPTKVPKWFKLSTK